MWTFSIYSIYLNWHTGDFTSIVEKTEGQNIFAS